MSAALDRVTDADRKFFERFPDREYRLRLTARAELRHMARAGCDPMPPLQADRMRVTLVRNVAPGMRVRTFGSVPRENIGRLDDLSDAAIRADLPWLKTEVEAVS